MKNIVVASAIFLASSNAIAHSNVCDYSLDYNVKVDDRQVIFSKSSGKTIILTEDELIIDGSVKELNRQQATAHKALYQETKQILPKIADIAIEGAEIGVTAATIVISSFFGNDPEVKTDLIEPVESVAKKIKDNINKNFLNTEKLSNSFDQEFDAEIESLVEKALSKYSGKAISRVIDAIFSNDAEEVKDFEFRMETLEQDIETYVDGKAKNLEIKAESLCSDIANLAAYDRELENIVGYPDRGVIYIGSDSGFKMSNITIN